MNILVSETYTYNECFVTIRTKEIFILIEIFVKFPLILQTKMSKVSAAKTITTLTGMAVAKVGCILSLYL